MNCHGLLVAYAEQAVKPVVSDFDTFTVGSRGFSYEPTPPDQVELIHWSLDHTTALLDKVTPNSWTSRWLQVITQEASNGFHPVLPKFGFGDPTSYDLIGSAVDATAECGAVRHGAECFNFYFPQELDDEFLVVWDGFSNPPWKQFKEPELRLFLLDRAKEGFSFPINPVWPVRDPGWFEVLDALLVHGESAKNLKSWFPQASGILERIGKIHTDYPNGFRRTSSETPNRARRRGSMKNAAGLDEPTDLEHADLAGLIEVGQKRGAKIRWNRIKVAIRLQMHKMAAEEDELEAAAAEAEAAAAVGAAAAAPAKVEVATEAEAEASVGAAAAAAAAAAVAAAADGIPQELAR